MCLFCSVLDHVTHGSTPPVTTDMAQQPTKEQVAKEKDLMASLKVSGWSALVPIPIPVPHADCYSEACGGKCFPPDQCAVCNTSLLL